MVNVFGTVDLQLFTVDLQLLFNLTVIVSSEIIYKLHLSFLKVMLSSYFGG